MLIKFFYLRSNNIQFVDSFKNERNELMIMWPNIVRELTENNEELPDVNKWITEVSNFFQNLYSIE